MGHEQMLCLYIVFLLGFYNAKQRTIHWGHHSLFECNWVGIFVLCKQSRKDYSQGFLTWRKRINSSVNPQQLLLMIGRSTGNIWFFLPWHFLFFPLGVGWQGSLRQINSQELLPNHLTNSIWIFHVLSVNILHFKFPLPFKVWFLKIFLT